ncbi:hypothetical protein GCM10009733_087440 [Nonomuraea maheshkhaliensis]|uniref:Carbohydrate kinase PfkB domain-containing protein n=1 Tax=Nonomuraea maheshkhaliensis TaxID=419590 RepID=A0ABP4SVU1_9ACTN
MEIAVLGDVLWDVDITGAVERISPEGSVPVVSELVTSESPGGAGLAALLLAGRTPGPDENLPLPPPWPQPPTPGWGRARQP